MPRPTQEPSSRVIFRLPLSVHQSWVATAKSKDLTLSNWLRAQITEGEQLALQEKAKPKRGKPKVVDVYRVVDPALLTSITRIGINLNQISRQLNQAVVVGQPLEAVAILVELQRIHVQLARLKSEHTITDAE